MHMSVLLSQFIPPILSFLCPQVCLYICVFIPAMQIGSSVAFSQFHIYKLICNICFLSFWLTFLHDCLKFNYVTTYDPFFSFLGTFQNMSNILKYGMLHEFACYPSTGTMLIFCILPVLVCVLLSKHKIGSLYQSQKPWK